MKANIVEDSKFGFKRVEPIPTQEEVEKFYAQEFYDANAKYFNNSALLLQEEQSDFFNTRNPMGRFLDLRVVKSSTRQPQHHQRR